jgi:hypothetical protein
MRPHTNKQLIGKVQVEGIKKTGHGGGADWRNPNVVVSQL